jgi:hypothetical protein
LEQKVAETAGLVPVVADLSKEYAAIRERVAVAEVRPLLAGPTGPAGRDGVDGVNGKDGRDGLDGKDGSPGRDGLDGKDGAPGLNGKDGADGLGFDDLLVTQDDERSFTIKAARGERVKAIGTVRFPVEIYRGVFVEGKTYERGDGVTWAGSEWHCNDTTTNKPGDGSKAWTLKVKKGRDGKDGRDATPTVPVVKA